MTRRELLQIAVAVPFIRAADEAEHGRGLTRRTPTRANAANMAADLANIREARFAVAPVGDHNVSRIELTRHWTGHICHSRLTNRGSAPVAIKEVVLFDLALTFPPSSAIYGEGFQMLSQTGGTLGEPKDLGSYTDAKHYRMPVAEGSQNFYGLLTIRADRVRITQLQRHQARVGPRQVDRRAEPPAQLAEWALVVERSRCVVLTGDRTDDEFVFHATAIYASGGMVLSGDDLTSIPEPRLAMLKKLVPPTRVPAVFEDERLAVGTIALPQRRMVCMFNWSDSRASLGTALPRAMRVVDFWTGQEMGRSARLEAADLPPHSARLFVCEDA